MSGQFPSKATVDRLREQYPPGTRVELISMDDPGNRLKPGDRGTVTAVDSIGTVFVDWIMVPALVWPMAQISLKLSQKGPTMRLARTSGATPFFATAKRRPLASAGVISTRR